MFGRIITKSLLRAAWCGGWVITLLLPLAAQSDDLPGIGSTAMMPASVDSSHQEMAGLRAAQRGATDSDGDGVADFADNCSGVANASQFDSNSDGFGNACDPDLDNNGIVNFLDLQQMQIAFFSNPASPAWNPDADFDNSGLINFVDLQLMQQFFFAAPGPSGMSCAGTVPCPEPGLILDWPMTGTDANDWVINNYVDLDAGGGILDYQGGAKSIDGHNGVDIDVPSFRQMDGDFPILASAPGTVIALEDGNYDRNRFCVGAWNFVTIGHPNGWKTIYGHLKKDSVVVSVGQVVEAGDVLGVVGSSGCSSAPHLHLEVRDENDVVRSPFLEGMWSNPPVYDTPIGLLDAVLYNSEIRIFSRLIDPAPNATIVPPGGVLGTGLSMGGGGPGDVINFRIVDGTGDQVAAFDINFTQAHRHTYWWFNYLFSAGASGAHQMQIRLNGNLVRTDDFVVAPTMAGFQQVRHDVPAASFQALFDDFVANGYRLVWIDGYDVNDSTFFNVIFDQSVVTSWTAAHGMDNTQYQAYFDAEVLAGRRLVHVDSYLQNGQMRHAAIFTGQPGTDWVAYHGATVAEHSTLFNTYASQGFRAKLISSVQEGGTQRITALYDKIPVASWFAQANLTSAQYQSVFNTQVNAGRILAYLNAYTLNGVPVFSAIFNGLPPGWAARHGVNSAQYQAEADNWVGNFGLDTRVVTGYDNGGIANFGALWTD